jgi:hypothetical protein
MYMVGFLHADIVLWKLIHDFGQVAVDSLEDGNTDAEVGSPKESLLAIGTQSLDFSLVVFHPSCGAAHHLDIVGEGLEIVAIGSCRVGKLDGDICRAELGAVDIFRVIHVNLTYDFVATLQGNLFDHVTHLAVANQSYFHRLFLVLFLSVLCFHARSCANLSAKIIKNIENTSLIVTINRKIWLFLQ